MLKESCNRFSWPLVEDQNNYRKQHCKEKNIYCVFLLKYSIIIVLERESFCFLKIWAYFALLLTLEFRKMYLNFLEGNFLWILEYCYECCKFEWKGTTRLTHSFWIFLWTTRERWEISGKIASTHTYMKNKSLACQDESKVRALWQDSLSCRKTKLFG